MCVYFLCNHHWLYAIRLTIFSWFTSHIRLSKQSVTYHNFYPPSRKDISISKTIFLTWFTTIISYFCVNVSICIPNILVWQLPDPISQYMHPIVCVILYICLIKLNYIKSDWLVTTGATCIFTNLSIAETQI